MGLSITPSSLGNYKNLAMLVWKYGQVAQAGNDNIDSNGGSEQNKKTEPSTKQFAKDLEKMGPTYIKLGQLLSTRPDLVSADFIEGLERLQENVNELSFEEVSKVLSKELPADYRRIFKSIEEKPFASASLAQVHRAVTHEGKEVVIKVQRPNIRATIQNDLTTLESLATFFDNNTEMGEHYEFYRIVANLREVLSRELDYTQERHNLLAMSENLSGFSEIVIPKPISQLCTKYVLVMEYLSSHSLIKLNPVTLLDIDGKKLARELFHAYLHQTVVVGFFHADPHPGNIHLTQDHKLAIFDFGMVGSISPGHRNALLRLLLGISDENADRATQAAIEIGEERSFFEKKAFIRDVEALFLQHKTGDLVELKTGKIILDIQRISAENGLRLPYGITLLGKALMNLDKVISILDPKFNPAETLHNLSPKLLYKRSQNALSMGPVYDSLLQAEGFFEKLPARLDAILENCSEGRLKVSIEGLKTEVYIQAIQKIANRITSGLLLSSMVVAASLVMDIKTRHTLFGYPAIAVVLLTLAAVGGLILYINSKVSDE